MPPDQTSLLRRSRPRQAGISGVCRTGV